MTYTYAGHVVSTQVALKSQMLMFEEENKNKQNQNPLSKERIERQ